ncbi:unknown protein [Seminavis robusta]|uniref:Uncharacterized protein n=1 Tax=Seminavis robusta TaxID=568900 RepID=A0A9N8E7J6_9STRA|nr:unknown protein [Seminavis robusta]|eukprot:Sro736_g195060.1 n/a (533) ;mRNA; f:47916-49624
MTAAKKKCSRRLPQLVVALLIALVALGNVRIVHRLRVVEGDAPTETTQNNNGEWVVLLDNSNDKKQRFSRVKAALQKLESDSVLTTKFTQRQRVLDKGYPVQWSPCVLERILRHGRRLRVTVVGGSMAARAGQQCSSTATNNNNPLEGRYSDLLEQRFRNKDAAFEMKVQNVAQGATTSVLSALQLDTLIIPEQTDVIIWDHAPNDSPLWEEMNRGGTEEEIRKLDFWLTRVRLLYAQNGKPPPPLILLHWWPPEWFKQKNGMLVDLDSHTRDHVGALIQSYRTAGWEIAVVDVGAPIEVTPSLQKHHRMLHDDPVHPSCLMTNFVADMLQHAFYSNWPSSGSCPLPTSKTAASITNSWPPHKSIAWYDRDQALWTDLFHENAKIASLNSWEPKVRLSSLQIGHRQEIATTWPTVTWEQTDELRADRKNGFVLPACDKGNRTVQILNEPDMKWLGVSLLRGNKLIVNDLLVDVPAREPKDDPYAWPHHHLSRWIRLPDHVPKSDSYNVSMCCNWKKGTSFFQFLIAVSLPEQ